MYYTDLCENASEIIGCFCTLVLAYWKNRRTLTLCAVFS